MAPALSPAVNIGEDSQVLLSIRNSDLPYAYRKHEHLNLALPLPSTEFDCGSQLNSLQSLFSTIKNCKSARNPAYAQLLHTQVHLSGLEAQPSIANQIIPLLVDCGCLCSAHRLFLKLVDRNEHAWTSLIKGYCNHGDFQCALNLFLEMQELEGFVQPSEYTFVAILKACGKRRCLERGRELHNEIIARGHDTLCFVGNTLVDLYAKCGSLIEASVVFHKLHHQDIVSWNALVSGYAEHGAAEEVMRCFNEMQLNGLSPNSVTFVCGLKAYATQGTLEKCLELHAEITKEGFDEDVIICSSLVDLYAKFGSFLEALDVFNEMPVRTIVAWTALIAGYSEHGFGEEALNCLEILESEGVPLDRIMFACILKACGSVQAIDKGRDIHSQVIKEELEGDLFICSSLVDMYAKCGSFDEGLDVIHEQSAQRAVSWNALITGYIEHALFEEALVCLEWMHVRDVVPDAITYICSLKACCRMESLHRGQMIHAEVVKEEFESDHIVGNVLIDLYAKCGSLKEAQVLFDELLVQDVVSWNTLISGYADCGFNGEVLVLANSMHERGVSPDALTFMCCLKAIGALKDIKQGQEIYTEIVNKGLEQWSFIGSTLVDMFVKCGLLGEAQDVFDKLFTKDVVAWTPLISGYAEHGFSDKALNCVSQMQSAGVLHDLVTLLCSLKACSSAKVVDRGLELHTEIVREGFDDHLSISNALIDMYSNCGHLADAVSVFDHVQVPDIVSWNSLIAGHAESGLHECASALLEHMQLQGVPPDVVTWSSIIMSYVQAGKIGSAVELYLQMQDQGVAPDIVTFLSILKACGNTGAIDSGKRVHAQSHKVLECTNVVLQNTLLDMYSKCGSVIDVCKTFDLFREMDLVKWAILILAYARQGDVEAVWILLERMEVGCQPNEIAFLGVFTACSHSGLVDKGLQWFGAMIKYYNIIPTMEHWICLMDLLGRAGQLNEAVQILKMMHFHDNPAAWNLVLNACCKWGSLKLGRVAFANTLGLTAQQSAASYVLMSNLFVDPELSSWKTS